jgi:transposase-like protein
MARKPLPAGAALLFSGVEKVFYARYAVEVQPMAIHGGDVMIQYAARGAFRLMRQRRRYNDDFRASATLMLEAAGYPERDGALSQVSGHLSVPRSTLRGWFTGAHNPPPAEVRHEKRFDLLNAIQTELAAIFPALAGAREDANYRELVTAVGILTDKHQLLTGQPTERAEVNVTDHRERILADIARKAASYVAGEPNSVYPRPIG